MSIPCNAKKISEVKIMQSCLKNSCDLQEVLKNPEQKKHGKSHRKLKQSQRNFDELLCQTTLPDRFQVCTSAILSVRSHHLSLSKS